MTAPTVGAPQNAQNYIVPSSGGTHLVPVAGVFGGTPFVIDWRQFSIDQFPFQPQGCYIDNSQGTGDLQVVISPIGFVIDAPAGSRVSSSFPAPNGQSASITGNGQASVVFVDYPVLPNAGVVVVSGTVNVDVIGPNPLPVSMPVNVGGVPYQVTEAALVAQTAGILIAAGQVTANVAPPTANSNLRKFAIAVSGTCTKAAAGENNVFLTVNGNVIFEEFFQVPATATPGLLYNKIVDLGSLGFNVGSVNAVLTIGSAMLTGSVIANLYFD